MIENTQWPISGYKISDILGNIIIESQQITNKTSSQIDMSGMHNGIYLINIQTKEGNITEKVIKE